MENLKNKNIDTAIIDGCTPWNFGVHFVAGKPGAGKGLWAIRYIVATLIKQPNRFILTNLAINFDALQCYVLDHGHDVNVLTRIRFMSDAETETFYLRTNNNKLPDFELTAPKTKIVHSGKPLALVPLSAPPPPAIPTPPLVS